MVARELVRKLIGAYSPECFKEVIKLACAPRTFVSCDGKALNVGKDLPPVRILGVVKDLPGVGALAAPLLVADVPIGNGRLTERSSRIAQFKAARKTLELVCVNPPVPVDGIIVQGIFAFHGSDGAFRVSLVTAKALGGKLVWSQVKRQSFYVTPDPDRNATFIQRMTMDWRTLANIKEAFSVEKLTKEFYGQLFKWYERACEDKRVEYPNDLATDKDNREDNNRKHLLRLITRLMFVWFLKQKGLVPDDLFDEDKLKKILKDFDPVSKKQNQYYRAILQNLFFATLNSEIEEREFAETPTPNKKGEKPTTKHHGVKTKYRYADAFNLPKKDVVGLFHKIPFLNGGLFECLDQENDHGKVMYYDGFSQTEFHRDNGTLTWARVPNDLFFDPDEGIIPLLKRYNFTVEENTPGDEDVALDPELLGKVFENLLGAYNPETKEIVRKSTGSFYTPREIVNYMVDESLIAYLAGKTGGKSSEKTVRALVKGGVRPDDAALCKKLVSAIESVKVLDPACGSGAFPMGALLKMTELLRILEKLPEDVNLYELKLKLIENCIFGVDIQEIAVQISKLRFFISLVCEQKPDWDAPNYGINTLPNLETKFVAANSLIGLKRTDTKYDKQALSQSDLFYDTGDIQKIKDELWKVRHKHFLAKTRKEKNALRKQDEELRTKLANRGKELGFSTDSTQLMASWDPYNQNIHAGFFEPEWMFNVKNGFDIVSGNPPYFVIKSDTPCREQYEKLYSHLQSGRMNIYQLFLGKSVELLSDLGCLSYIHPKTLLGDKYLSATRSYLLRCFSSVSIVNIVDRRDTFDSVLQSVIVSQWNKVGSNYVVSEISNKADLSHMRYLSLKREEIVLESGKMLVSATPCAYKIVSKMGRVKRLMLGFVTGSVEWNKYKNYLAAKDSRHNIRILFGENVQRYALVPSRKRAEYSYTSLKSLPRLSTSAIVCQRTTAVEQRWRIVATIIDAGKEDSPIVTENSINVLPIRDVDCGMYVLGVLNSTLLDYYFRLINSNTHVSSGELNALPIPECNRVLRRRISSFVEKIIAAKKNAPNADTSALEAEIDELVYDLYGLTAEEREIVEKSVAKPEKVAKAVEVEERSAATTKNAKPKKSQFAEEF